MNRMKRFLPPAFVLLFVTACADPIDLSFDADLPAESTTMQGHLQWNRPDALRDLTATVGTPMGEYELIAGAVMFDGMASTTARKAFSFWAVKGENRYIKLAVDGGAVLVFGVPAASLQELPDGRPISDGDSVLITVELDTENLTAHMAPSGLKFNERAPAVLSLWYHHADGDFNADGVVNKYDAYIENNLLGMWYRQADHDAWTRFEAVVATDQKRVTARIYHFSGYAVSW